MKTQALASPHLYLSAVKKTPEPSRVEFYRRTGKRGVIIKRKSRSINLSGRLCTQSTRKLFDLHQSPILKKQQTEKYLYQQQGKLNFNLFVLFVLLVVSLCNNSIAMVDNELISINEDLGVILEKKQKYHREQIAFHQAELQRLSNFIIPRLHSDFAPSNGDKNRKDSTGEAYDKPWWWEKNIPDLVNSLFPTLEFRNADLMKAVGVPGTDDEDYKKMVRYAISLGLKANVNSGFLKSRQEPGMKGYLYKKK